MDKFSCSDMIALPTLGEPFEVICDASTIGIGVYPTTNRFWESKVFSCWKELYHWRARANSSCASFAHLVLLFGRCGFCGSYIPRYSHLFKVTRSIVHASYPMVIVFRPKHYIYVEYMLWCFSIIDSLSHNLVGCNIYANILSHNSLACRDAKLRALLTFGVGYKHRKRWSQNIGEWSM